jgi:hypothetical protein
MGTDRFDGFNNFGNRVWEGVDEGQRSAKKFKYLMGVVSQTLVTTHLIVLGRLRELEAAQTAEEVQRLLEDIRGGQLNEAFRVEGLCDTLGGLGQGLIDRSWAAQGEGLFSDEDLAEIREFAEMLYDREDEVAKAYVDTLSAITDSAPDQSSLPDFREGLREIERKMTAQVVDFRAKASRFMTVSAGAAHG